VTVIVTTLRIRYVGRLKNYWLFGTKVSTVNLQEGRREIATILPLTS